MSAQAFKRKLNTILSLDVKGDNRLRGKVTHPQPSPQRLRSESGGEDYCRLLELEYF